MYLNGIGINQNIEKGIELLTRAAENGHYAAMYELGKIFLDGKHVPQNFQEAYQRFSKAAEKGNHYAAMHELGKMYLYGKGIPKDLDKALECLNRASEGGHNEARILLFKVSQQQEQYI